MLMRSEDQRYISDALKARRKECKDKINDWVILFSSVLLFKKSFRVLWNKNYIFKSNPSHLDDVMINIMQCAQWGKIWNLRNLDPVFTLHNACEFI